jgi:hypothetical protein
MIEPITSLAFSVFENKGVYALLLGSGVSRAAQIPTGWEIILDLIRRVGALEEAGEQGDWASWYQDRFGKEPNYSDMLDMLSKSPDERRAILHRYIEPTAEDLAEGRKVPTRAHVAVAKLVRDGFVRVIITTNFDRLIENALREQGVEPTVIASDDDLQGAVPLVHSRCYVIKIHGDYLDTRIRNTEEELTSYSEAMGALLDRILDEHGLIVCGWSADWDHALREVITRTPNRRYPLYWASRGRPSASAEGLIAHRHGNLVQISDAESFFDNLQRKVEVQAALGRTNPKSLDLLLAEAKRYLSKAEFRIQLHDLVAEEVRHLQSLLVDGEFETNVPLSAGEFRRRVARYEAVSERLVRLFGQLGRWGDGSEFNIVRDVLRALGKRRIIGGLQVWIYLKSYPAVLLLYGYGIGALQANRYEVLFRWLTVPLEDDNGQPAEPAVWHLFLWGWFRDGDHFWTNIEGMERRKTPLSDHLHNTFAIWLGGYTLDRDEFELLFEHLELMASLTHMSTKRTKDNLTQAVADQGRDRWEWVPFGRTGWNDRTQRVLLGEVQRADVVREILGAGFCKGDEKFLELALQNLQKGFRHLPF